MFFSVAYFCLVLFRRSALDRRKTRRKRLRNRIYGACGVVILVCMVTMVSLTLKGIAGWLRPLHPLLCCESLALFAFGVAWLTKGEGLLRDLPHERVVRHLGLVAR
jgi:cobalamin biosynthesis protein CobD/CbiB